MSDLSVAGWMARLHADHLQKNFVLCREVWYNRWPNRVVRAVVEPAVGAGVPAKTRLGIRLQTERQTMGLGVKAIERQFEFKNCLDVPTLRLWADEVVRGIELDRLLVLDPCDKQGLHSVFDEKGRERLLFDRVTIPISIAEWFAVGCQRIRWSYDYEDTASPKNASLRYVDNAAVVLWPCGTDRRPQGPAAFLGEVAVSAGAAEALNAEHTLVAEAFFKANLARVLAYVLDLMKLIAPAFLDWHNFWDCLMGRGANANMVMEWSRHAGSFAGGELEPDEIERIAQYWPTASKAWLGTCAESSNPSSRCQ